MFAGGIYFTEGIKAEAACSGWTWAPGAINGSISCNFSDRCAVIFRGTGHRTGTKERYCDKNGQQVRETTYADEKDGCCA
jgi:hypothetical protein